MNQIKEILEEMETQAKWRGMQEEFPFFLRGYAIFREIGSTPIEAIENATVGLDSTRKILNPLILKFRENGIETKRLIEFALGSKNDFIIRGMRLVALNIESGESPASVMNFSKEMLNEQKLKNQEKNSSSSIFTLAFVSIVCMVPVLMFLGSVLISQINPNNDIPSLEIIIGLIIPIISTGFLLGSKIVIPKSRIAREVEIIPLDFLLITPTIISVLFIKDWSWIAISIAIIALLVMNIRKREIDYEETEEEIFASILGITSIPKTTNLEQILRIVAQESKGGFKREITKTMNQIDLRISPIKALVDMERALKSKLFRKLSNGLLNCQKIGSFEKIGLIIDDIVESRTIERERRSQISMQKYTIYASMIISPIILKSVIELLGKITQNNTNGFENMARSGLFLMVFFACQMIMILEQRESAKYQNTLLFGILTQLIFYLS